MWKSNTPDTEVENLKKIDIIKKVIIQVRILKVMTNKIDIFSKLIISAKIMKKK